MYNFVDTTETQGSALLPSEALKLNGEYIENLIPGYRTLQVSGRESLSPELNTYETGIRDGARLKNKRYPARVITIKYQLIAESNEAFRNAFNKLGGILDVKDAELIFADEPEMFFTGTPSTIREVDPGKNAVVGEFEILCVDPFKYSVYEFEATADLDESSVLIDYNGTRPAFPKLEAAFIDETEVKDDGETAGTLTGNGDCGYVAFFTADEKIVQLGNPDEVDGSNAYAKSQTLINQTFPSATAWGTTAKKPWAINNGSPTPSNVVQAGNVAMAVAAYTDPITPASTSGTLLKVKTSTGSPLLTYTVTAKTSERTASTVKVSVSITSSLAESVSGIGKNREIEASLYIGGAWRTVTLKKKTDHWKRYSSYTTNLTLTVSGLAASTTSLTGIRFKATRKDSLGQAGILAETACNSLAVSQYIAVEPSAYYLKASSYGSASNQWHGPSITRTLTADAAGEIGATNFTLTYKQKMCIGSGKNATAQLGAFQAQLVDANGANVAGVRIHKNKAGTNASIIFYVNGAQAHSAVCDLSYNNKLFGAHKSAVQTSTIQKSGGKIVFNIGGIKKTITDSAIAEKKVTKVMFMFEQWGSSPALEYNGLYSAKLVKDNCTTWKDIPNKFSANDVVVADCNTGEIFLNGTLKPELGALGNDWEEFTLVPGMNQIGFSYSEWVDPAYAPEVKVRYREVFL